ncbi:hypothetical protein [Prosthecobacter sp.]|uniref:hypothetical protein n=1 Tax=Prosthecobacter sp. TaxID=1965333 RepID=UPI0037848E1E
MANSPYLLASHDSQPAGYTSDGETNYDFAKEVISDGGKYQLPIFWLSLFTLEDVRVHHIDDNTTVLTLVCRKNIALQNLEKHRPGILEMFPGYTAHWDSWEQFAQNASASYFKVDATELWDLDPESFDSMLSSAVRWFESREDSDFEQLLSLGALNYNAELRSATLGNSPVTGENLYGYRIRTSPPPLPGQLPPPLPQQPPKP